MIITNILIIIMNDIYDDILYVIGKQYDYNSIEQLRCVSKKLDAFYKRLLKEVYDEYYDKLKKIKESFSINNTSISNELINKHKNVKHLKTK